MTTFLLWSHPIMQCIALLAGLFALWQGFKRFAMSRGKKVMFPWKTHVKLGTIALVLWIIGLTGFIATYFAFEVTHVTGIHANMAIVIAILAVFGLVTGFIMNKYKKRRKILPLVHGIANVILLVLVLVQGYVGVALVGNFLLG